MNILINSHIGLLQKNRTAYSGAQFFSNSFLDEIKKTKRHSYTAIIFEKNHTDPKKFGYRIVKQGKNRLVIVNAFVDTQEIYQLARQKQNPNTQAVFDKLVKLVKDLKTDVFFLNGFSALMYVLTRAAHEAGLPILAVHHGLWFKEADKLKMAPALKYTREKMEHDSGLVAQTNTFVSKLSKLEYEKTLGRLPGSSKIISVPYPPGYADHIPPVKKNTSVNIGLVGRWDIVKNHGAYLALAKEAKRQNLNWNFYAVTLIEPYPHYDKIVGDYKRHIKIIRPMTPHQLKKFYLNMNVLVVPSHFETYSSVVTESLLENRPVLISPTVGWIDFYKANGLSDWIIKFDNPKFVINKIKKILNDGVPNKIISKIKKENNPDYIFGQYFKALESLS